MSDGRKYFCFCADNCKFETMTKEQILAAIAQAAEGGLVFDADAAFITKVKEGNAGKEISFWVGTEAQYNALDSIDPNCIYIKTDSTEKQDMLDAIEAAQKAAAAAANAVCMEKVWENASPTSNFAAQTIALALSTYDEVRIDMCSGTNAGVVGTYMFKVGGGTQMTYGAGAYMGRRNLKVTTSGVTFEGGSKYESAWGDSNAYQKPFAIYGLKGVQ